MGIENNIIASEVIPLRNKSPVYALHLFHTLIVLAPPVFMSNQMHRANKLSI